MLYWKHLLYLLIIKTYQVVVWICIFQTLVATHLVGNEINLVGHGKHLKEK